MVAALEILWFDCGLAWIQIIGSEIDQIRHLLPQARTVCANVSGGKTSWNTKLTQRAVNTQGPCSSLKGHKHYVWDHHGLVCPDGTIAALRRSKSPKAAGWASCELFYTTESFMSACLQWCRAQRPAVAHLRDLSSAPSYCVHSYISCRILALG